MAAGLALVAALLFAAGTALWQRGTLQTEAKASDPRFYVQIRLRETHRDQLAGGVARNGPTWTTAGGRWVATTQPFVGTSTPSGEPS